MLVHGTNNFYFMSFLILNFLVIYSICIKYIKYKTIIKFDQKIYSPGLKFYQMIVASRNKFIEIINIKIM